MGPSESFPYTSRPQVYTHCSLVAVSSWKPVVNCIQKQTSHKNIMQSTLTLNTPPLQACTTPNPHQRLSRMHASHARTLQNTCTPTKHTLNNKRRKNVAHARTQAHTRTPLHVCTGLPKSVYVRSFILSAQK